MIKRYIYCQRSSPFDHSKGSYHRRSIYAAPDRKTRHYLPQKGMYRYVTSANYLGEIIEWAGWAILTCSLSGLVFFWWTMANLVPRANAIWHRYREEFGSEVGARKRVFPFIY